MKAQRWILTWTVITLAYLSYAAGYAPAITGAESKVKDIHESHRLYIEASHNSARIRNMSITPKFEQGQALSPGKYKITVDVPSDKAINPVSFVVTMPRENNTIIFVNLITSEVQGL